MYIKMQGSSTHADLSVSISTIDAILAEVLYSILQSVSWISCFVLDQTEFFTVYTISFVRVEKIWIPF